MSYGDPNSFPNTPTLGGLAALVSGGLNGYQQGQSAVYQRAIAQAQMQRQQNLADSLEQSRIATQNRGQQNADTASAREQLLQQRTNGYLTTLVNKDKLGAWKYITNLHMAGESPEVIGNAMQQFHSALGEDYDPTKPPPGAVSPLNAPPTAVAPPTPLDADKSVAVNAPALAPPMGNLAGLNTVAPIATPPPTLSIPNVTNSPNAASGGASFAGPPITPNVPVAPPALAVPTSDQSAPPVATAPPVVAPPAANPFLTPYVKPMTAAQLATQAAAKAAAAEKATVDASNTAHQKSTDELAWDKQTLGNLQGYANAPTEQQAHAVIAAQQDGAARGFNTAILPPIPGSANPNAPGGYNPKIVITPQQGQQNATAAANNAMATARPVLTQNTVANTNSEIVDRQGRLALAKQARADAEANDAFNHGIAQGHLNVSQAQLNLSQTAQQMKQQGGNPAQFAARLDSNYTTAANDLATTTNQVNAYDKTKYIDSDGKTSPTQQDGYSVNPLWSSFETTRQNHIANLNQIIVANRGLRSNISGVAPQGTGAVSIGSSITPAGGVAPVTFGVGNPNTPGWTGTATPNTPIQRGTTPPGYRMRAVAPPTSSTSAPPPKLTPAQAATRAKIFAHLKAAGG